MEGHVDADTGEEPSEASVDEPLPRDPPPPPGWEDPLEGSEILTELRTSDFRGRQRSRKSEVARPGLRPYEGRGVR